MHQAHRNESGEAPGENLSRSGPQGAVSQSICLTALLLEFWLSYDSPALFPVSSFYKAFAFGYPFFIFEI